MPAAVKAAVISVRLAVLAFTLAMVVTDAIGAAVVGVAAAVVGVVAGTVVAVVVGTVAVVWAAVGASSPPLQAARGAGGGECKEAHGGSHGRHFRPPVWEFARSPLEARPR